MTPRIYLFPRLGCLGWLIIGWLIVLAYVFIWGSVIAFALLLYAIAGLGVVIDWALTKTVRSYRDHRVTAPIHWPQRLADSGTGALAQLGGYRGRP